MGAFYPFSRSHNALGSAPQELYLWETVTEAAQKALGMRYRLLPYLYSLFYSAHNDGAMVARPLWANFPSDPSALSIDRQFMLGSAILVSPVLDQGVTTCTAYFPKGFWYSLSTLSLAIDASEAGFTTELSAPLTDINVHIYGGNVLPMQGEAMTTEQSRKSPFTLVVALCPGGKASGNLYWDDGEQVKIHESKCFGILTILTFNIYSNFLKLHSSYFPYIKL